MAAVTRRGKGWQVRWRTIDGRRTSRTCPDARTAQRLAREIEQSIALGIDWQPCHTAEDPQISDIAEAFLHDRARTCKQATLVVMTTAVNHLLAYTRQVQRTGRIRADILRKSTLSGLHQYLVETVGVSPTTANSYVRHIQGRKGLWNWGANDDRFADIMPRPRTIDLPADAVALPQLDIRWPECDMAIDWPSARAWHRRSMLVGRYTMLRRSQIFGLLWSDVDMERALLRIRPELGKSRQERRGRLIPVSQHLIDEIAGWGTREGHLIAMPGAARVINERPLRQKWYRSGAVPDGTRIQIYHLLRKAGMRELALRGVSMDIIKALVGHNRGVTGDVYVQTAGIMPLMREAVGHITPTATSGRTVSLEARRAK